MRSGELAAALVSYRAALKADPRGQAAYVATSSALHLLGDPNAAVEVLEQGLAARSRTRASDAWWRYPEGRKSQLPRLLKRLRQEACQ
jgi:predicted Zn-dependent protease